MFKITYITHSSILIETEDAKVITDPWFNGPAYLDHWHVFPKPIDISYKDDVTHVFITHGHEDHCHIPTLGKINKDAMVYAPYTWLKGIKPMLAGIGFKKVQEVNSYKTISVGKHLKITFIVNGLDSVLLIEHKNEVYLNLNDAFNATHKNFIKLFAGKILKRWPVINYLMCGVGGAGYFPNTIHSPQKNDIETAILREQFLMQLFCEFIMAFRPKVAIPFLPGFVLLEQDKLWINEIRQPRNIIEELYRKNDAGSTVEFWNLYPGDQLSENKWHKTSPYYNEVKDDDWSPLIAKQYPATGTPGNSMIQKDEVLLNEVCGMLNALFKQSTKGISPALLRKLRFAITLKDITGPYHIRCAFNNNKVTASVSVKDHTGINLEIQTTSTNLFYAIKELWGGDVFFIGYGADIHIIEDDCIKDNLDILSLRILSRFPTAKGTVFKDPFRTLQYLYHNRVHSAIALKQKISLRNKVNKIPFNERSHWINKSKCEICLSCNLPLLTNELAQQIK